MKTAPGPRALPGPRAVPGSRTPPPACIPLILCLLLLATTSFGAPAEKPKPAKLKISGYGLFGNRELKRMLRTLDPGVKKPEFFGADFVEDAALILASRVKRDGFLTPEITVRAHLENGGRIELKADDLLDNPLPRPLRIIELDFTIRKGVLFHYRQILFEGLQSIAEKEARSYFIETGTLFHLKRNRIYTPEKLQRGLSSLSDILDRQGYQEAKAEVSDLRREDKTGAVNARITIHQGPKSIVRSVREEIFYEQAAEPMETRTVFPNQPYSRLWLQDFTQSVKTNQYHHGYPDTTVTVGAIERKPEAGQVQLDLAVKVNTGRLVRIGDVKFEGEKRTRKALLSRRVRVKRGDLLDPIKVEEGRYRLAQLGSFDTVDLSYQSTDDHTRDVTYRVQEGKTTDFNLLFGYGSYELLRAGFEIEQFNIWGRAHHARLKAIQSFKASSADFSYTMPEFVGKDLDVFVNASGLRREEITFTREEYGGGFGVHKYFKPAASDLTVRYNYQILNAADTGLPLALEGLTNTSVGAIITDLKHDRRDNPLYPSKGYKVFSTLELASEYLAGDVNYERLEIWTSWHQPLGGGRTISLGLSHGVVLTAGTTAQNLPFNRRFFPGGQNSIRGYQEGEAAPRDPNKKIIGAETYTLGIVEFEQALTPHWSMVLFSDSLGFAERVASYPFDTGLFSAGGGIRWKTIIGPVRLEYGHNLNPRKGDPAGTLQFSLGFPF